MTFALPGCSDDTDEVRRIQAQRRARQQSETKVDHLGEAVSLVSRLIELDQTTAGRQIVYHLNAWQDSQQGQAPASAFRPTALLRTVSDIVPLEESTRAAQDDSFSMLDVYHLRDAYLHHAVMNWVQEKAPADPMWSTWIAQQSEPLGSEGVENLLTATKLFDWVVRNIALEPLLLEAQANVNPNLPLGMTFRGPGYRQTPYQTLFRGTGDALQRMTTFVTLCRQASLPACVLGIADGTGQFRPWVVGVLVANEVYLFECGLGVPIAGPGQVGIATLKQARTDASVLRRMNVPGWFDYPVQKDDVQQCAAMLVLDPETVSVRSKSLQTALTGDLRMTLYQDADAIAAAFEAMPGIASARIWDVPLLARVYELSIQQAASQDPMLSFLVTSPWIILDAPIEQAKQLSLGRWRHLQGRFDDDEETAAQGAKSLYLNQRQPEFEIADLRIDVELQKQYGIRRDLGVSPEIYDRQIQQVQSIMRQGKNTASLWLGLLQFDSQRFDLAQNWLANRVLQDEQVSRWEQTARYSLARAHEQLNAVDKAIELYRTEGDLQEHGNRIRARFLARANGESEQDDAPQEAASKADAAASQSSSDNPS